MVDHVTDFQSRKAVSIAQKCREMLAKEQKPIGVIAKYVPENEVTVVDHVKWVVEPLTQTIKDCRRIAYKAIDPKVKPGERVLALESIRSKCIDGLYEYGKLLEIKATEENDPTKDQVINTLQCVLQDCLFALDLSETLLVNNGFEAPEAIIASKKTISHALGKKEELEKQAIGGE